VAFFRLLILQAFPAFSPIVILSENPVLKHYKPIFVPQATDRVSHLYKTTGKIVVCII
jgi:hypothetical protein